MGMSDVPGQSAVISAGISLFVAILAYLQSRRKLRIELEAIHDKVTQELIEQRISPYRDFMSQLEPMSRRHEQDIVTNRSAYSIEFAETMQAAIYGPIGVLASNDTREIIVYARAGWLRYQAFHCPLNEVQMRVWAIHQAIRSDLGLAQPAWQNEIDRRRRKQLAATRKQIKDRVDTAVHMLYDIYSEAPYEWWLKYKTLGPLNLDKSFRAIIIDMDGVMLDSEVVERKGWQLSAGEFHCSIPNDVFERLIGRTEIDVKEILTRFWQDVNQDDSHFDEILTRKNEYVSKQNIQAKTGIHDLLHWARTQRILTAVATSTAKAKAIERLRKSGIDVNGIDVIVGGDETPRGKPAPDIFRLASTYLGIDPGSCIVLEDSPSGIEAASEAGALPVLIPDASVSVNGFPETVRRKAFKEFSSLDDTLVDLQALNLSTEYRRRDRTGSQMLRSIHLIPRGVRVRLS